MASNRIKGLTVEIGGDTTKLGKALEAVDKKSKDLSGELGEINRLLKLDPGNTELLSQKQRVLADAISNTARRLDTLKEAERQAQEQFKRGEVSEDQVRALQREIIATEKKMEGYKKAAKQTADQIDNLGDQSDDAKKDVKKVGDEAKKTGGDLDDAGDKASDFGEKLKGAGALAVKGFAAVTAAVTAAVGALVASAEATRDYRREMGKLDAAFLSANHTVETATTVYKKLQGVIGETDQTIEAAQQIALLATSEEEAAKWAELAAGVVGKFGAALQPETFFEAANETAKLNEATGAFVQMLEGCGYDVEKFNKGLQKCKTAEEEQAYMLEIANQLLGEAGTIYSEVNGDIIKANEATEAWTSSMAAIGAEVEPVLSNIKLLGAALLSDLVPGVQSASEAFQRLMAGEDGAAADFGEALSGMLTQLLNKITEMAPQVAEMGIGLISSLAQSILGSLPQMVSTGAEAVGVLIEGIMRELPVVGAKAIEIIGTLVQGLKQNLPQVLEKGAELLSSLGAGIASGLPALIDQALDIIMDFAETLYDNAPKLIEMGINLTTNLVQGIMDSLPTLLAKAPEIISKFANVINHNFPTILMQGVGLVLQIITGIIQAIPELVKNAPKIIRAIVDVWCAFNWLQIGKQAITGLANGVKNMVGAVKTAGQDVLNSITGVIQNLPGNLANFGRNAMTNLGGALSGAANTMRAAASGILNTIVNVLKGLPSKMLNIGKDLVSGIWNGIADKTGWLIDKIGSFTSSVLDGIKGFFGIHSPSTKTAWMGEMLDEGFAKGIEDNARTPIKAMANLSTDMLDEAGNLNGLTIERNLAHTFTASAAADGGMLSKLDRILDAIERGQVIKLDGDAIVGGTAAKMDAALGRRRALAARGAI